MIEFGAGPGRRRVALAAIRRKTGGDVVGSRHRVIYGLVTGITIGWRPRELAPNVAI